MTALYAFRRGASAATVAPAVAAAESAIQVLWISEKKLLVVVALRAYCSTSSGGEEQRMGEQQSLHRQLQQQGLFTQQKAQKGGCWKADLRQISGFRRTDRRVDVTRSLFCQLACLPSSQWLFPELSTLSSIERASILRFEETMEGRAMATPTQKAATAPLLRPLWAALLLMQYASSQPTVRRLSCVRRRCSCYIALEWGSFDIVRETLGVGVDPNRAPGFISALCPPLCELAGANWV